MKRAILTRKRRAPLAARTERGVPRVGRAGAVKAGAAGVGGPAVSGLSGVPRHELQQPAPCPTVIPANAGIQRLQPALRRKPAQARLAAFSPETPWIPAFAGMTCWEVQRGLRRFSRGMRHRTPRHPRERGDPETSAGPFSKAGLNPTSSVLTRNALDSRVCGNDVLAGSGSASASASAKKSRVMIDAQRPQLVIPAKAGIQRLQPAVCRKPAQPRLPGFSPETPWIPAFAGTTAGRRRATPCGALSPARRPCPRPRPLPGCSASAWPPSSARPRPAPA